MSKISPLAPLSDIHSLSLEETNLFIDRPGHVESTLVHSFDNAWLTIMQERGIFTGRHESKIVVLQNVAKKLKESNDAVKSELKKQTLFVRNNRDEMETMFKQQMQESTNEKDILAEELKESTIIVGNITKITEVESQWQHFVLKLNRVAATSNLKSYRINEIVAKNRSIHNDRAVYLAGIYRSMDRKQREANTILHRVAKVENVLLKLHLKIVTLELYRCKTTLVLQQDLGTVMDAIQN